MAFTPIVDFFNHPLHSAISFFKQRLCIHSPLSQEIGAKHDAQVARRHGIMLDMFWIRYPKQTNKQTSKQQQQTNKQIKTSTTVPTHNIENFLTGDTG